MLGPIALGPIANRSVDLFTYSPPYDAPGQQHHTGRAATRVKSTREHSTPGARKTSAENQLGPNKKSTRVP